MQLLKRLKNLMSSKPDTEQAAEESHEEIKEVKIDPIVEESIVRLEENMPESHDEDAEELLTAYQLEKKKLAENIAKYGEKNIRNFYFGIPFDRCFGCKDPKVNNIVTAVTVLDREAKTIRAAFACCSKKDQFCRVSGKNRCFKKLDDNDARYTATVPFYGDGFISLMAAYSIVRPNLPHPFRNYKLTPTRVELLKSHEKAMPIVSSDDSKSESSTVQPEVLPAPAPAPEAIPVAEEPVKEPSENVIDDSSKPDSGYRAI